MKNKWTELRFDEEKGTLTSLQLVGDPWQANFIKEGRGLGELHDVLWYYRDSEADLWTKRWEKWEKRSFAQGEREAEAVFSRRGVAVTEKFLLAEEDLRITIEVKNENAYPVYFQKEDLSLYTPFADSYDDSLTAQRIRCHAHIAPFYENSYVRTERMGESEHHLGLLFLKGSAYSYSQEFKSTGNNRGYLYMNIEPFSLNAGESYVVEWAVFAHRGEEDFFEKARKYEEFVDVRANAGYVLERGEEGELTLTTGKEIVDADVRLGNRKLTFTKEGNRLVVPLRFSSFGEKKIDFRVNGRRGAAYFHVSPELRLLQEKRAKFIMRKQQCLDKKSPLYGAYLIYDNDEKRQYFSYEWTDQNANRERMVMGVFLAKYLRKTGDAEAKKSVELFTEFLLRECVDEDTGRACNNIGKAMNVKRLYNAPWVILYFCELYLYDGEKRWIDLAFKMIFGYYENGGANFYPNGIRFSELYRAFKKSGQTENIRKVLDCFWNHIRRIEENGTNYPPHEVNYEQTIVTPAACLLIDAYLLSKEEKYLQEAKKHLSLLKKFNGSQPDYRLYAVPLRYWDNYWFGKRRTCVYGDTLPHPALAHSAHCFYTYGKATGDEEWIRYGLQMWKAGYCLFNEKGEGRSSYVYPERLNGEKGAFFDPLANEQDGFLYMAYKLTEEP